MPKREPKIMKHRLLLREDQWNWLALIAQAGGMSINVVIESIIGEAMDAERDLAPPPDPAPYATTAS